MRLLKALLDTYIHEMRGTEHRLHMQVKGICAADTNAAQYVQDGILTLNISERAAKMEVTDTGWVFHMRFGKVPVQLVITPVDVVGIYALHNSSGQVVNMFNFAGNGITFHGAGLSRQELESTQPKPESTAKAKASHLKLVH